MTASHPNVAATGRAGAAACALVFAGAAVPCGATARGWQPPDIRPTTVSLSTVLAANAKGAGTPDAAFAQRRERWTYANGAQRFAVQVAVRGSDYRVDIALGAAKYAAGRLRGVPWRSDANGVAHATYSDDQGDALDRVPRAVFALDRADLTVAGETRGPAAAWVLADRPARDKPHWLYVDRASGDVVREVVREGVRTIVTTFDRFTSQAGLRRPSRWHVRDGDRNDDLDVQVDAVLPEDVDDAALALPAERRVFAPLDSARAATVTLPTHFDGATILVDAELDGTRTPMVLDTGTASIMLDSATARRLRSSPVLEHATIPAVTVGGLGLSDVSVFTLPFDGSSVRGILGLDFFFGHVVHIDYRHRRVDVLAHAIADPVFADPTLTVLSADVGEGLPLVHGSFGPAVGGRFAIDTGSPHLYVLDAFARRWPGEIAAHWSPARFPDGRRTRTARYLEGPIAVSARRAALFALGPLRFPGDVVVGVEDRNALPDGIAIPLDAIVGTDVLTQLELWLDYDNDRLAIRPNGS